MRDKIVNEIANALADDFYEKGCMEPDDAGKLARKYKRRIKLALAAANERTEKAEQLAKKFCEDKDYLCGRVLDLEAINVDQGRRLDRIVEIGKVTSGYPGNPNLKMIVKIAEGSDG